MKRKKQPSKIKFIKDVDSENLVNILESYDSKLLNNLPYSERELLEYYENYTDPILTESRRLTNNNVFPLGNEVRAMLGHLADYRQNSSNRKNLEDAYGHFRRLNIDAFKVICDEADKALFEYLNKHKSYDLRNVNSNFLYDYSKMYFSAKQLYLKAQLSEKSGSDRKSGNVLEYYCRACLEYANLLLYLKEESKGINTKVVKTIIGTSISTFFAIASVIASILSS